MGALTIEVIMREAADHYQAGRHAPAMRLCDDILKAAPDCVPALHLNAVIAFSDGRAVNEDSPWYPTMPLFRQGKPQAWDGVIARVADELGRMAGMSTRDRQAGRCELQPVREQAILSSP